MQGELVCAWCNTKKKDVELVTQGQSHGICPACLERVFGFTVRQMLQAHTIREEQTKLAKSKKRRERREAKKRKAAHVS